MVAYRVRDMSAMVMADVGELLFPVSAGPVRGPRFARLLDPPERRVAARAIVAKQRHELDVRPGSTNNSTKPACSVVVNVYARTRLRLELEPKNPLVALGETFQVVIGNEVLAGNIVSFRALARLISPAHDLRALLANVNRSDVPKQAVLEGSRSLRFDPALVLAALERKQPKLAEVGDRPIAVAHHDGPLHVHVDATREPGVYHLGVYVEGVYCPAHDASAPTHAGHARLDSVGTKHSATNECSADCGWERFTRLLNVSVAVVRPVAKGPRRPKPKPKPTKSARPTRKPRKPPRRS
jgi:hypothetical protein